LFVQLGRLIVAAQFCCICGAFASVCRTEPVIIKPIARDSIYRRRGFDAEIIEAMWMMAMGE